MKPRRKTGFEQLERRELLTGQLIAKQLAFAKENVFPVAEVGPLSLFVYDDGGHGREIWRTDGTERGTSLLKDISPGYASTGIQKIVVQEEIAYFGVVGSDGAELWRTDGTTSGTLPITTIHNAFVTNFVVDASIDGHVFATVFEPEARAIIVPTNGDPIIELDTLTGLYSTTILETSHSSALLTGRSYDGDLQIWVTNARGDATVPVQRTDQTPGDLQNIEDVFEQSVAHDGKDFIAAIRFGNGTSDLFRITEDGFASRIPGSSQLGTTYSVQRAGDSILVDSDRGQFYLDATGSVSKITSSQVSIPLQPIGESFVYGQLGEYPLSELQLYNSVSGTATKLSAPPLTPGTNIDVVGNWIVYTAIDPSGRELVALNVATDELRTIRKLVVSERIQFTATTDNTLFYQTTASDQMFLGLVDLSSNTDAFTDMFSATASIAGVYGLHRRDQSVHGFLRSDIGTQIFSIELLSGDVRRLANFTADANAIEVEPFTSLPNWPIFAIDGQHFTYQSRERIWVSDGSPGGTRSVQAPTDLNNLLVPRPSQATNGDVYYWDEDSQSIIRVYVDTESQPLIEMIPVGHVDDLVATETGVLFLNDGNAFQIDRGSVDPTLLVGDLSSRQIMPLPNGSPQLDSPFRHRVLDSVFINDTPTAIASDGSLLRSGVVDSLSSIVMRSFPEGASSYSYSDFSSSDGAFFIQLFFDDGDRVFVERPGQAGLQPFFPIERTGDFGIPTRIDDGWILTETVSINQILTWVWKDDGDSPHLLDSTWGQFAAEFDGQIVLRRYPHNVVVASDLFAHDGDDILSLHEMTNLSGYGFNAKVVGESDQGVIVMASTEGPQSQFAIYVWDGFAHGLQPIPEINQLIQERDLGTPGLGTTKVVVLDEYYLFAFDGYVYRVPRSQQSISLAGPNPSIQFSRDQVIVSTDSDSPSNRKQIGDLLSVDLTQTTGALQLVIDDGPSIPINGIHVSLSGDAEVVLTVDESNADVRYEASNEMIGIYVDSRVIWIHYDHSIRLVNNKPLSTGSVGTTRDIVVDLENGQINVRDAVGQDGTVVTLGDSSTIEFMDLLDRLRISGVASENLVEVGILNHTHRLDLLAGSKAQGGLNLSLPDSLQLTSATTDTMGTIARVEQGSMLVAVDITAYPLHNPLKAADANGNNHVSAADALLIINRLATHDFTDVALQPIFPDVNRDGSVSAIDALQVINFLARQSRTGQQVVNKIDRAFAEWVLEETDDDIINHQIPCDQLF